MIRTPDHRVRVFVSSTLGELSEERVAAREAIQQMRLSPVMFELGARSHPPRELYRSYLEQSDVFVGIYWQRYGWTAPDMTVSGVEDEYLLSGSKPRLLYVKQPAPVREPPLGELLTRIQTENHACYKPFATSTELQELIENDLAVLLTERFVTEAEHGGTAETLRMDNLPVVRTSLIDRLQEVAAARDGLAREGSGVVTLTGSGGTGKTRIALEVARSFGEELEHGVCFVDLSNVTDPTLLPSTIARALGLQELPGRSSTDVLIDGLRNRRMLVVLDNFEQVIRGARVVTNLLAACPRLRVLVTSRQPLNVRGEKEIVVPPLPADGPDSAASRLFLDRARDVKPGFASSGDDAATVAEICRRLDGVPLAIELAAARARVLTPQAMLGRLDHRLSLLTGGAQDLPERQRTMRATMEWSHDLLDPGDRVLYRRLAVFMGGFHLDAADAVMGGDLPDVLDGISSLVTKSLLRAGDADGEPRFFMLSTVREYGLERLQESGEAAAVAERHARHYATFAHGGEFRMRSSERTRWLARLETEIDNLRAAFDWGMAHDPALALQMCLDVMWFWYQTGRIAEGEQRTAAALAAAERVADASLLAHGTCALGMIASAANHVQAAVAALDNARAALAAQDDPVWFGRATAFAGLTSLMRGDPAKAIMGYEAALPHLRRGGDRWFEAMTLMFAGEAHLVSGDRERARALYEESLALYEELADPWGRTNIRNGLADIAAHENDLPAARAHAAEAEKLSRQLTDMFALGRALCARGNAAVALGDLEEGEAALRESVAVWRSFDSVPMVCLSLLGLATAAAGDHRRDRARALYAAVRRPLLTPGIALMSAGSVYVSRFVATLDAELGETLPEVQLEDAVARALRAD